jgi:hypothetical protein
LREFGDYPVLGALSLVVSPTHGRDRRRAVLGFCAGTGMLAVVLMLGFAFDQQLARIVQHFVVLGAA